MAVRVENITLAAATVATVDLTGPGNKVAVTILDVPSPIYFNVSTTGSPAADPTVGGDDFDTVPGAVGATRIVRGTGSGNTTRVKLISSGVPVITVELVGE
jgi:hypothetical protein